jgi:hypothetical protein
MTMVCGLDLRRRQITFDALHVETGEAWTGRVWQPDRERFRRWLRDDVTERRAVRRWGRGQSMRYGALALMPFLVAQCTPACGPSFEDARLRFSIGWGRRSHHPQAAALG